MLAQTQKHLDDLKAAGFDVSSLETQIKNPILEKQADKLIGGGILRQEEFSRYMTKTTEEKNKLEKQVKELAALHDSANALVGNDEVYKAALELITKQEDLLITAGYDPEEVRALSFDTKEGLKTPPKVDPATVAATKEKEDNNMPTDFKAEDYIKTEEFQAAAANQIYGSVALSSKINAAMRNAEKLGIELTDENVNSIAETIRKTVESGGSIDHALDINFGLSAKKAELDIENQKKAVEAAREEGRAEGLKEAGVPRRSVSKEIHPLSKISHIKAAEPDKIDMNNVPKNKFGDTEVYRTRGDASSRIENAELFHEKVLQRENAMAE